MCRRCAALQRVSPPRAAPGAHQLRHLRGWASLNHRQDVRRGALACLRWRTFSHACISRGTVTPTSSGPARAVYANHTLDGELALVALCVAQPADRHCQQQFAPAATATMPSMPEGPHSLDASRGPAGDRATGAHHLRSMAVHAAGDLAASSPRPTAFVREAQCLEPGERICSPVRISGSAQRSLVPSARQQYRAGSAAAMAAGARHGRVCHRTVKLHDQRCRARGTTAGVPVRATAECAVPLALGCPLVQGHRSMSVRGVRWHSRLSPWCRFPSSRWRVCGQRHLLARPSHAPQMPAVDAMVADGPVQGKWAS